MEWTVFITSFKSFHQKNDFPYSLIPISLVPYQRQVVSTRQILHKKIKLKGKKDHSVLKWVYKNMDTTTVQIIIISFVFTFIKRY